MSSKNKLNPRTQTFLVALLAFLVPGLLLLEVVQKIFYPFEGRIDLWSIRMSCDLIRIVAEIELANGVLLFLIRLRILGNGLLLAGATGFILSTFFGMINWS